MTLRVRKRDGRLVPFDQSRITNAVMKALVASGEGDGRRAKAVSDAVVAALPKRTLDVEGIQDAVEAALIKAGYAKAAKAYILHRHKRAEIRAAKKFLGVVDELKMTTNAINVLQKRYLLKDEMGAVKENPAQMFRRVAKAVAAIDAKYGRRKEVQKTGEEFYRAMSSLEFVPNSPTLMNAGTPLGQLAACFVIPVEDNLTSIFDAVKHMALIQQSGGGTGFAFSKLRPKGDIVRSTKGVASGPVSFIRVFDTTTDVIKQGGKRRGANMGILHVTHPDVVEFITSKAKEGFLANFNISVAVTDAFMRAAEKGKDYGLINPRTGTAVRKQNARDMFDLIATMAWKTGDPGLVFIDEINRRHPTPQIGGIDSTNPCGEVPLLPYESCNLGSINLGKMATDGKVDWKKLRRAIRTGVHFLDNIIDANRYPLKETEKITKANRKIGLGVMGFADMLAQLGVPYDSERALKIGQSVAQFLRNEGHRMSRELGKERGSFPNFKGSTYDGKCGAMRNATVTTIAPTGTISIIAGCSSGIEPFFAISYVRNVLEGSRLLEVNPYFEKTARERRFYSDELMMGIARSGTLRGMEGIPGDVKKVFVTAFDISPEWHVRMQAAFQKHSDNAVSKTINLPHDATIEDVKNAYLLAYRLRCKGITVYRYGSKPEQVLTIGPIERRGEGAEFVSADAEYSGGCPYQYCPGA